MKPIVFFFRGGRTVRLAADGKFPTDLLYGYEYLSQKYPVQILEQDELSPGIKRSWIQEKWLQYRMKRDGIKWDHVEWYSTPENLAKLNEARVIFTTTGSQGVALSILRQEKKLTAELIFLATGLCDYSDRDTFWRVIQKCAGDVIWTSLSHGEIRQLEKKIGATVHYVPFGTDMDFWSPPENEAISDPPYVISVGNDAKRDYELLVKAWKSEYPELRIVTQRKLLNPLPHNIKQVDSDWCFRPTNVSQVNELLSQAEDLREMYRKSLFVVVPLQETFQPSGQSVTQQGMISKKAVLVSKIQGMWNDNLMVDQQNCYFVTPGNVKEFQNGVETLLNNKELRERLGKNGCKTVQEYFSTKNTAAELEKVLRLVS
ncbi:MAG: glycosyltransferase family 4 protein [Verrucomicrobiota bacterium]